MKKNKSANKRLSGRDELNLIDYPLSMFSKNIPLVEDSDEDARVKEIFITDPNTKKLKQGYVKITSNVKGATNTLVSGDEDVLIALMELTAQTGFTKQKVDFTSQNKIFELIGWGRYGDNYQRLLDAFRRLRSITIETNVFYDRKIKQYGHKIFGLLDEAYITTESNRKSIDKKKSKKSPGGYFVWNATIWESFKKGNIKYLDTELYRRIKNPGARKLFRILDKRFYNRNVVDIPLDYLAGTLLRLNNKHGQWYYKKFMSKYADELTSEKVGYLKDYYYKDRNQQTYIYFELNTEQNISHPETQSKVEDIDDPEIGDISAEVFEKLLSLGFNEEVAKDLMLNYEIVRIDKWLQYLDSEFSRDVKSKTGYLVEALRQGYEFPNGFDDIISRRVREQKYAEETMRKKQDDHEKIRKQKKEFEYYENIMNSLSPLEQENVFLEAKEMLKTEDRDTYDVVSDILRENSGINVDKITYTDLLEVDHVVTKNTFRSAIHKVLKIRNYK